MVTLRVVVFFNQDASCHVNQRCSCAYVVYSGASFVFDAGRAIQFGTASFETLSHGTLVAVVRFDAICDGGRFLSNDCVQHAAGGLRKFHTTGVRNYGIRIVKVQVFFTDGGFASSGSFRSAFSNLGFFCPSNFRAGENGYYYCFVELWVGVGVVFRPVMECVRHFGVCSMGEQNHPTCTGLASGDAGGCSGVVISDDFFETATPGP